jgi:hypothetical protein
MSIAQLFFKKGNFISTVEIDAVINEGASATVRVTENPVEFGANMNDHIITEPMAFTVTGIVSNISSNKIGQFLRVPTIFSQGITKSKEAWEALLKLQANGSLFELVQGLKTYSNVTILSLNHNSDKDTANGLFFTATMKEIIFAGAEIITKEQFTEPDIADKMVPSVSGGLKGLGGV